MLSSMLQVGSTTTAATSSSQSHQQQAEEDASSKTENDSQSISTDTVAQATPQKLVQQDDTNITVATSTVAHSSHTPLSNRSPDDVSKEELLDILTKMNKRVKALNSVRLQLQEKFTKIENDNLRLMSLLKEEILSEGDILDATNQLEVVNTGT